MGNHQRKRLKGKELSPQAHLRRPRPKAQEVNRGTKKDFPATKSRQSTGSKAREPRGLSCATPGEAEGARIVAGEDEVGLGKSSGVGSGRLRVPLEGL